MREKWLLYYYNMRLCLSYNVLTSVLLLMSSLLFFHFKGMGIVEYLKMGETYLPLTGMLLLVYIGGLEEHIGSWEMVCAKNTKYVYLHALRFLFLALLQLFLFSALLLVVWIQAPDIRPWDYFWGIYIGALFVGTLGMVLADISGSYSVGYVASLGYYVLGITLGRKFLDGYLQLTGYRNKQPQSKYVLFGLTVFLIALDCVWRCIKQRLIRRRRGK